jgi:hypothetical protein
MSLWKGVRAVGVFSDSVWMCTDGLPEDKLPISTLEAFVPSKGITHWALIAALHKVVKACKAKTGSPSCEAVFKLSGGASLQVSLMHYGKSLTPARARRIRSRRTRTNCRLRTLCRANGCPHMAAQTRPFSSSDTRGMT